MFLLDLLGFIKQKKLRARFQEQTLKMNFYGAHKSKRSNPNPKRKGH